MAIPIERVEDLKKIMEEIKAIALDKSASGEQLTRACALGIASLLGAVTLLILEEVPEGQQPAQYRGAFQ